MVIENTAKKWQVVNSRTKMSMSTPLSYSSSYAIVITPGGSDDIMRQSYQSYGLTIELHGYSDGDNALKPEVVPIYIPFYTMIGHWFYSAVFWTILFFDVHANNKLIINYIL